jgi:hypothetical protein
MGLKSNLTALVHALLLGVPPDVLQTDCSLGIIRNEFRKLKVLPT